MNSRPKKQLEVSKKIDFSYSDYKSLANTLPVGVYRIRVFNKKGSKIESWKEKNEPPFQFEFLNDRFCEILKIEKDEFIRDPGLIISLIQGRDKEQFALSNAEANQYIIPFKWEGQILAKNVYRWIRFMSTPMILDNKDIIWTGVLIDITEQKTNEHILQNTKSIMDVELAVKTKELEELKIRIENKNIALSEMIDHLEVEKDLHNKKVAEGVNKFVIPQLDSLKLSLKGNELLRLEILENSLHEIVTEYGIKVLNSLDNLTPKEVEICNLIKQGKTSKEISNLLFLSEGTIFVHRNNIRKKLGIDDSQVNLTTYLNSI